MQQRTNGRARGGNGNVSSSSSVKWYSLSFNSGKQDTRSLIGAGTNPTGGNTITISAGNRFQFSNRLSVHINLLSNQLITESN